MAAAVESVIQQPVTKSHRHRGAFALAAGLVVAGTLATTVVLADDSDGPSPAPQVQGSAVVPQQATEADLRLAAEWARTVEGSASYTDLRLAAEWARRLEILSAAP